MLLKQAVTLLLFTLTFSVLASQKLNELYLPSTKDQERAYELFKNKQYDESEQLYLRLSNAGDKYAQYIMSIIYLHGLTGETDKAKAYAWAKVAKENQSEKLLEHFNQIKSSLTKDELQKYEANSDEIYSKYSNLAVAERHLKFLKKEFPKCTGSRSKVNVDACQRIQVTCNVNSVWGGNTIPDLVSSFGDKCLEFAAKIQPENLKKMKSDIEDLELYVKQQKSKGRVIVTKEQ